jgi:hypothetical protein
MVKYTSIPLLFFFLASLIGVFLRWQFILPTPGINYTYFLHAHSHTMFLGWVFNALYLGFIIAYIKDDEQKVFKTIFLVLQLLVVAMMISFPVQGYGLYSILFSTLHTLLAIVFIVIFFRKTKNIEMISCWFARTSLLFFTLSTLGPFSLGYLMANGLGQSQWYNFSIYYYLHFQYNGFFLFGVLSLFFQLLEGKQITFNVQQAKAIGQWMALACVPAYFLSVLWAKPGIIFNGIAGIAGLIQLYALVLLFYFLKRIQIPSHFSKAAFFCFVIGILAFSLKIVLQLFSALPTVANFAYEFRPIVIAYLHLVLIGIISVLVLGWYIEKNFINQKFAGKTLAAFLITFTGTQIALILQPWWNEVSYYIILSSAQFLMLFSILLSISCFLFLLVHRKQVN